MNTVFFAVQKLSVVAADGKIQQYAENAVHNGAYIGFFKEERFKHLHDLIKVLVVRCQGVALEVDRVIITDVATAPRLVALTEAPRALEDPMPAVHQLAILCQLLGAASEQHIVHLVLQHQEGLLKQSLLAPKEAVYIHLVHFEVGRCFAVIGQLLGRRFFESALGDQLYGIADEPGSDFFFVFHCHALQLRHKQDFHSKQNSSVHYIIRF